MSLTRLKYPLIIAHRGYSLKYPENTLISFQAALDAGAQMIEMDVTLSRDRRIVVIHDDTLHRTTNGQGRVDTHTLDALKALDAGSWFDPRYAKESIPTLEEVLNLVKNQICINIEIKSSAYESHHPEDAIETQVVELISKNNMHDSILISSFEWNFLENIRQIDETIPLAMLSKEPVDAEGLECAKRLKAFAWNQNHRKCNADQINRLHDAGLRVFVYTVNTTERFRTLIKMGVDGIFSDNPTLPF